MNLTALQLIMQFLFGRKYYANIIYRRGCASDRGIASFIFITKADAIAHRNSLADNLSYGHVETVSFRSRNDYASSNLSPR